MHPELRTYATNVFGIRTTHIPHCYACKCDGIYLYIWMGREKVTKTNLTSVCVRVYHKNIYTNDHRCVQPAQHSERNKLTMKISARPVPLTLYTISKGMRLLCKRISLVFAFAIHACVCGCGCTVVIHALMHPYSIVVSHLNHHGMHSHYVPPT